MSRNGQGGTQKWCATCKAIQVCAAVNPSQLRERSGQWWYRPDHADIQWFRRGLICQRCRSEWLTAEVEEKLPPTVRVRSGRFNKSARTTKPVGSGSVTLSLYPKVFDADQALGFQPRVGR